jgi:hypothetical protein
VGVRVMPIRSFVGSRSFDPETIEIMNKAFLGVCGDLGLRDTADPACELVAKRVIELVDDQRDPEVIRNIVRASIQAEGE